MELILHELRHREDILPVSAVARHAKYVADLSILRKILSSRNRDHLGMATASANLSMNLFAFLSMYSKNAAGAGIVCRDMGECL